MFLKRCLEVTELKIDGLAKSPTLSLRGAKRRACALKRFGAQAWRSYRFPDGYEIAALRSQ
jgi:hypothetical protein